jgi:hypothetical protein
MKHVAFAYLIGILTGAVLCFGAMNMAMQARGLVMLKPGEPGQILVHDEKLGPRWAWPD